MPKIKTSRTTTKRSKETETGKLVRNKVYKSYILTKKSTKRKRNFRKDIVMDATSAKVMKKALPYLWSEVRKEGSSVARVKDGMNVKKGHNRVLKMAKGYRGVRPEQYRVAK